MGAAESQLDDVLRLVTSLLGDAVIGSYLHGSAVLGGLQPDSDLDVLVVVERTLDRPERIALVDGLLDISGRRARRTPGRPIELSVVVGAAVRRWSYPPDEDFQYGEWLRDDYEAGLVPAATPNPDLAVLLTTVLSHGKVLSGPPPQDVLAPVPQEDLLRAVLAGVPDLLEALHSDTRNVLLTLARIWMTLATGEVTTKDRATEWALDRLPSRYRPALNLARLAYLGEAEDEWEERRDQVGELAAVLSRELDV